MPSFLTKVFGRKKDEKEHASTKRHSGSRTSLLEGKFEAVSPTVSPSVQKFEEREKSLAKNKDSRDSNGNGNGKEKEKEKEKDPSRPALFRPKSRTASQPTRRTSAGGTIEVPKLSLDPNLR